MNRTDQLTAAAAIDKDEKCPTSVQEINIPFHLSTNIPACTACTMLRNLGFSSERRTGRRTLLVKVEASQSVTSAGTPSDCSCWRSSSVSRHCLSESQQENGIIGKRSRNDVKKNKKQFPCKLNVNKKNPVYFVGKLVFVLCSLVL